MKHEIKVMMSFALLVIMWGIIIGGFVLFLMYCI